jgi:hypothetical protein
VATEWQHFSVLIYAIPGERVRALLPHPFEAVEIAESEWRRTERRLQMPWSVFQPAGRQPPAAPGHRRLAFLSVASFLDSGVNGGGGAFEQTDYRLHARLDGEPCHWLLGTSLGSLSAVAPRHLWAWPWHLSAMEFRVAYDQVEARYRAYRLHTQSQWANACWEIADSGEPLEVEGHFSSLSQPLPLLLGPLASCFVRRDGQLGASRAWHPHLRCTRGFLKLGRCDLLERLGLLTANELARPALVAVQRRLTCDIYAPSVVGPPERSLTVNGSEERRGRFGYRCLNGL